MGKTKAKSVRLQDVARASGVSVMTASRALRGESVSEETRQRVLAAAEKRGYEYRVRQGRPRRVPSRARPCVDVVVSLMVSPTSLFYSSLLIAVEQTLARRHLDCVIRTCGSAYEDFVSLSNVLQASAAEGVLITGFFPSAQLTALLACHPRCLLLDHTGDPRLESAYDSVAVDYADAARQAIRYLLGLGRRRIILMTGDTEHYFCRDIALGYTEMLTQAGIKLDPAFNLQADLTAENAYDILREAMRSGLTFDGVFTNDEMALGVLRALHEFGRRVPQDVAVVGCDGLPVGACSIPSLTTLEIDTATLAELAVNRLMERGSQADPSRHIRLCAQLRKRESA